MLKRLIATVLVKQGIAVQSFGYNKFLPLGKPEVVIKNLDRWMVDEILVISIDHESFNPEPDLKLLEKIVNKHITTPLIFGGGVRTINQAKSLIQNGADRIILESLFNDKKYDILSELSQSIGNQAIIRCCPLIIKNNIPETYLPKLKKV